MKTVAPMLKRQGRNISIPFFVDLWLRNQFDGKNGFSNYVLQLIIADLKKNPDFVNEFGLELRQLGLVH